MKIQIIIIIIIIVIIIVRFSPVLLGLVAIVMSQLLSAIRELFQGWPTTVY